MKKKLSLKKSTIANLSMAEQQNVMGGSETYTYCYTECGCGSLPNTLMCETRPLATCGHCQTIDICID